MKRLDLTLATSRTYIPCQKLCDHAFRFYDLRIMHACTLKMLNKKKSLCLVCKYFFLSHYQPNAGSCFVLHICCFMAVLKVSDAAVPFVF